MFQVYRLAANQAFPSWNRKVKVGKPHASLINAISACQGEQQSLRVYDEKGERVLAECCANRVTLTYDTLVQNTSAI